MWPFCCCNKDQDCFSKAEVELLFLKIIEKLLCRECEKEKCHPKHCVETGCFTVASGKHEGFIQTKKTPSKVYLSGTSCHQVCGSNQDLYAAEVVPNGFKFAAVVANEFLKLDWIAEFEPCKDECQTTCKTQCNKPKCEMN
jgi:hypothetical protein